jgi:hypothetical protein
MARLEAAGAAARMGKTRWYAVDHEGRWRVSRDDREDWAALQEADERAWAEGRQRGLPAPRPTPQPAPVWIINGITYRTRAEYEQALKAQGIDLRPVPRRLPRDELAALSARVGGWAALGMLAAGAVGPRAAREPRTQKPPLGPAPPLSAPEAAEALAEEHERRVTLARLARGEGDLELRLAIYLRRYPLWQRPMIEKQLRALPEARLRGILDRAGVTVA